MWLTFRTGIYFFSADTEETRKNQKDQRRNNEIHKRVDNER